MASRGIRLALFSSFLGLAACGGSDSDGPGDGAVSPAEAASNIKSAQSAIEACTKNGNEFATTSDAKCGAEIAALTDSAFTRMEPQLPELDMKQLKSAITSAVEYAVETGQRYSLDFTFSEPDGSEGSTVTINPVMAGDRLASSEPTPVINHDRGVYADQDEPAEAPDGSPGWYFRNDSDGSKVNWYMYAFEPDSSVQPTFKDLQFLEARVTHVSETDNNYYFFNVYTRPQDDGNDCSWYRSRVTLVAKESTKSQTSLIRWDRKNQRSGDAVAYEVGDLTTALSTSGCNSDGSIDEINGQRLYLISFETNSNVDKNDVDILLEEMTLGFSDGEETVLPVHASEPSDDNFVTAVPDGAPFIEISSNTALFDGLIFELEGSRARYDVSRTDGEDMTVAQKILLEKLDRGEGYNALVPEAVFNPTADSLVFDFGTDLTQADLANLQAKVYSDKALTNRVSTITIGSDGRSVSVKP